MTTSPRDAGVRRPTAEECWSDFWSSVASCWTRLPAAVQQEHAARYPRGTTRARDDFVAGRSE